MSDHGDDSVSEPILKAVSSSTRQVFQLLNCVKFANKAEIQISDIGMRVSVEDSRAMQGKHQGLSSCRALTRSCRCRIP